MNEFPQLRRIIVPLFALAALNATAREYHVSVTGKDCNEGSKEMPLRTINAAAQKALPGDTVTVHNGVYREWVNPLNGGESNDRRILYRVAEGEKAELKGSEVVGNWKKVKGAPGTWMAVVPNTLFGNHNPFAEKLFGDWLWTNGRTFHTGDVYLNDVSLYEAASLEKVIRPDTLRTVRDPQGSTAAWFAEVGGETTTLYAHFGADDPNKNTVEIAVRPTCFYPTRQGLNYITIRGFHVSQAATQWGAPTAEQVGMIATHWCKGWIIENNRIKNSRSNGISLGKERGTGHNLECTDPRLDGTLHYIEVIFRTLRNGWNKEHVGGHIVRNNVISDCEQTAICGSMGGAFCEIYGNHIYNIWAKRQYGGAEMAGIKLHGAIDTYIHNNRIHRCGYGVWLDWMAQGAHVSSNLFYHNDRDLFTEVDHGPIIVDNNLFLSGASLLENTDGVAYVNNLFAGIITPRDDSRYTPYHEPHSTDVKGFRTITNGDHRFYNNLFIGGKNTKERYGLQVYDKAKWAIHASHNIFCNGARPIADKQQGNAYDGYNPNLKLEENENGVFLTWDLPDGQMPSMEGTRVDKARLGITRLTGLPYELADGTPFELRTDYFGKPRRAEAPCIGPVEFTSPLKRIQVWKQKNDCI